MEDPTRAGSATTGRPADRWRRVEALLDELLESADGSERDARLARLASEEPELAGEVRGLLSAALEGSGDLLDRPLAASMPALLSELERAVGGEDPLAVDARSGAPRTIDRYRLLEVLGRGGMGVVYLAERADQHFEKSVALKLIPRGLETPEKERRFLVERQILARLEHPGIARLLDGGVTDEGYPYLVMERVDGEPIDRYCEARALPLRARLELFLEVCAAVQYAHGHLVVHRDLKPGNILVTGAGHVKLLDFGVAKILDDDEPGGPPTHLQPLTPDYASPEQRANRPVSTASDVYSLGILLFRLLTGTTPARLARARSGGASGDEAAGELRPPAPSAAIVEAERLGLSSAPALPYPAQRLRGDLDRIVLKALAVDAGERYVSSEALAEDLRRHLDGLPITARPATRRYRVAKFVGRHRAGTAIAALVGLLLVAGASAIVLQSRLAHRERDRARTEAERAERVAEFVGGLFEAASPTSLGAGRTSLRDVLDQGEAQLRSQLGSDPAVRGKLLEVLANAYTALGELPRALDLARQSVADLRRVSPPDAPALASALTTYAAVQIPQGGLDAAEPALREARALLEGAGAVESRVMARLLQTWGLLRSRGGREEESAELHREALRLWRALGAEAEAAAELSALAGRMDALGRPEEALSIKLEALSTLQGVYGDLHPAVLNTRNNIAFSLHTSGSYAEAEAIYLEVLAGSEAVLGEDHTDIASPLSNLGKVLMDQGRFDEAARYVRRAAEIRRRTVEPDHFGRIAAEINLASLELGLGAVDEAIDLYRSGLERFERLTGEESLPTARCRSLLGIALQRAGDRARAEALLRSALARQEQGARALEIADTLTGLGSTLSDRGRAAEALPLLERALALRREALPSGHWSIGELQVELANALHLLGRSREAAAALDSGLAALGNLAGHDWARRRADRLRADLRAAARS